MVADYIWPTLHGVPDIISKASIIKYLCQRFYSPLVHKGLCYMCIEGNGSEWKRSYTKLDEDGTEQAVRGLKQDVVDNGNMVDGYSII